jgi:tRNA modification GTPase
VGRVGPGLGDEVVAVILGQEPPQVEIQCHGGHAAVLMVLDTLMAAGARLEAAEVWRCAASSSLLSAHAWIDLPSASTVRTAEILLDQAHGALERELRTILSGLETHRSDAFDALEVLRASSVVGLRLLVGWVIVLAGRPNVGKSRLFNALAGFERAIVAPTPGTTRDVVTTRTAIDGWPVELADTAGLRVACDPIEAEGVARAQDRQQRADRVLLVLDRSVPLTPSDFDLMESWPEALRVANKADLPAAWNERDLGALAVSAERGDGVAGLIGALGRSLVPNAPAPGSPVPFRERHRRLLRHASRLLRGGRSHACGRAIMHLVDGKRSPDGAPRNTVVF